MTLPKSPLEKLRNVSRKFSLFKSLGFPARAAFESPPSALTQDNEQRNEAGSSSRAAGGFQNSLNTLYLPRVLAFLVFPSMFVFIHIGFYQVTHLHRVDLATLAVAHLVTTTKKEMSAYFIIFSKIS